MKETFLRIERFTSGLAMAGACAMLAPGAAPGAVLTAPSSRCGTSNRASLRSQMMPSA